MTNTMPNGGEVTGKPVGDPNLNVTDPGAPTAAQTSAKAVLESVLSEFGLESLAQWAWEQHLNGSPIEQIMLDLRKQPAYKARFPYMDALGQKGRAITEREAIAMERTYAELGRQFGLPPSFYDQPDDFTRLITNEVSPAEYSDRLGLYQQAAFDVDPTVRQELHRLYGVTDGDLAAWFIDPDRAMPILTRKARAADVAAQAQRQGFGALTTDEAERLSILDRNQAAQGFGQLNALREVLSQLPGEAEAGVSRESSLALLEGSEEARQTVERRARRRTAAFESGGGYSSSNQGIAGIG